MHSRLQKSVILIGMLAMSTTSAQAFEKNRRASHTSWMTYGSRYFREMFE